MVSFAIHCLGNSILIALQVVLAASIVTKAGKRRLPSAYRLSANGSSVQLSSPASF